MSHASKVVRNIFWLALEPSLGALISISLAGFVATRLGLRDYGQLTFAVSFVVLFGAIANLGMNEVLLRAVARQAADEAKLWSSVMAAKAILLLVYVGVVLAVASAFGYERSLVIIIGLMSLVQGLFSIEQTTAAIFAGRQNFRPAVTLRLARTITETIVTVAMLLAGFTVVGLAASRVVVALLGAVAVVVLAFSTLGVRPTRPSPAVVRPLIGAGISFAGISLLINAGARGGVLVLHHFSGFEAVALFSAAMALVDRLLVFLPSVLGAVFPFFSAIRSEDKERFSSSLARALRYQTVIAVGLGLGTAMFGPWLLHSFFPRSFDGAGRVITVLGAYAAIRTIADLLNSVTQARGLEKQVALVWGCRCVMNIAIAALLVVPLGAVGLAWALVAADAMLLSFLLFLLARAGTLAHVRWSPLLTAATAGVLIFVAFTAVADVGNRFGMSLVFGALYPLCLIIGGVISTDDWRYLGVLWRGGASSNAVSGITPRDDHNVILGATEA